MGRTTKQLSGGGKDKFLRALLSERMDISTAPANQLLERFETTITDIRVKRDAWDAIARSGMSPAVQKPKGPKKTLQPSEKNSAPPVTMEHPSDMPTTRNGDDAQTTMAFDPFSFSALAVLTKSGKAALAAKVAEIHAAEHLIALAAAQHLGVDRTLSDVNQLRVAIVAATEARLKERRAAAS